jgi:arginine utilization protein RocB|tara:strand:+ start:295 stop:468 length:174 start_codon:yes stop_codon:yes gene_type:complete
MRDTKGLEAYTNKINKEKKAKELHKNLRKEVETGANGTQKYVVKQGKNKGKVASKGQ